MKNYLGTCLALLCLACSVSAQSANAPAKALSPLEQTLMSAEKSFVEAAKKGDVGFFKRTLTDDFSFVGVDGQLSDRQAMLDQFADGGQNLQPYGMKVVTAGDDAAIVTYDVVVRVPPVAGSGTASAVSALQHDLGEAGGRVEDEVSADDGGALGRLVERDNC